MIESFDLGKILLIYKFLINLVEAHRFIILKNEDGEYLIISFTHFYYINTKFKTSAVVPKR